VESEVIEVLQLREPFLAYWLRKPRKGQVATEAQIENSNVREIPSNLLDRVEDRLPIKLRVIIVISLGRDDDVEVSALALRWNEAGAIRDNVAEDRARSDARSVVSGIGLVGFWMAVFAPSVVGEDRVPTWHPRVYYCNHWQLARVARLRGRRRFRAAARGLSSEERRLQRSMNRLY
jgi:hypothetical protein